MRYAVCGISSRQASNVDQISNDRGGGRLSTGPLAVIQGDTNSIALDHHRIHRTLNIGQQTLGRNKRWMNAQLNPVAATLGDTEQLDAITELFRVLDVRSLKLGNAFNVGFVKLDGNAESNGRNKCCLVRSIDAFDIEGRISLSVAKALSFFQHVAKRQALVAHFRQNEISRAIDDASRPFDAVGSQAFAQRLDDGNTAGNRRFKSDHHALLLGSSENLRAMHGKQRLVGSDHVLAIGD